MLESHPTPQEQEPETTDETARKAAAYALQLEYERQELLSEVPHMD